MSDKFRIIAAFNDILGKLPDIEVVRDKIVYLVDFTVFDLCIYFGITFPSLNHLSPYFCGQSAFRWGGFIP